VQLGATFGDSRWVAAGSAIFSDVRLTALVVSGGAFKRIAAISMLVDVDAF
jgi:hypothetical protein